MAPKPKRKVTNLLALAVLSYLVREPMHPYELSRALRDNGDARSVKFNHGSLYMVVGQLAKAGLITEAGTSRDGGRPERTVYELTDAGRTELRNWMRDLIGHPEHEYPHFVAALSLIGVLPPDEVVELLGQRRVRLDALKAEARAAIESAGEVHPLFLVEEEYRLALLDAESRFIEGFVDRIVDPVDGWGPAWAAFHTERRRT
ncbi:PadR family transcriptional regulator [Phytomonospora sp. NPDC050363]|uniref:PadR family transcriptional regulator n=1 Tax=Phytomonospora sp. NPDC050363 TaxID=3155642 RepID=UPI0033DF830D